MQQTSKNDRIKINSHFCLNLFIAELLILTGYIKEIGEIIFQFLPKCIKIWFSWKSFFCNKQCRDGPWTNPSTLLSPTRLWPGYFLTRPQEIFFGAEWKKIEIFGIFRGNFPNPNPNHKWLARPEQQKIDPIWVKNFWPGPITKTMFKEIPQKWALFAYNSKMKRYIYSSSGM